MPGPESSLLRDLYWFPYKEEPMDLFAAPSFLLPSESPDSLWHLFCSAIPGACHHKSTSGLAWEKGDIIARGGRTPSVSQDGNSYHMAYARSSSVFLSSSVDLASWSKGLETLKAEAVPYASYRGGKPLLSYPQLVPWKGHYRLYFGAGESDYEGLPAYYGVAESAYLEGPYEVLKEPLLSPEPWGDPPVLAAGPLRIIPCQDALAALQAAVCYDEERDRTYSSLFLLFSQDGLGWERGGIAVESRESGWSSGLITGADAHWKENERTWYCFYSAVKRYASFPATKMGLLLGQKAKPLP